MILFVNVPLLGFTQVYAVEAIAMNPLYIPIIALVTATAVGSGIIANGTQDAIKGANQLVQNVISNIKSSEIQKSEADSNYVSPFSVINGGKPEKPSNDNKNGKWVALGAGALASNEIWTNKEAVESIMSEINKLNGYNKTINQGGIKNVSDTNLISTANASGVALQLAQFDSRLNTQFTEVINSDVFNTWVSNNDLDKDSLVYSVCFSPTSLASKNNRYPSITVSCVDSSKFSKIGLEYNLGFNTLTGKETSSMYAYSYSFYYLADMNGSQSDAYWRMYIFKLLNSDGVAVRLPLGLFSISERDGTNSPTISNRNLNSNYFLAYNPQKISLKNYAYCGFKWASENPWTFTNNVYNSTQTFNVNFPDWLQQSINLLGQELEGLRLGITNVQPSWNPTQEQIQSGTSPTNVINQYINNYQNPEYIPEDNPNTGGNDEPSPEPETEAEPATEVMVDEASQSLFDWALDKIQLPDGFWEKLPFSIPYDMYLLIKAVLPSRSSGRRKMLKASFNSPDSANGITITSYYDASGANVRSNSAVFEVPAKWSSNAPVINWDLHFKYTGVDGTKKQLDYVKTVDLSEYAYFAMIIYIAVYVAWMGAILGFIFDSFK